MTSKTKCPHCGNKNSKFIHSNGEPDSSPDLSMLCMARVKPEDWSFADSCKPAKEYYDANGLVPCGMQWDPNQD